jgi:8-oxo-dGTP diphosphatase
LRVKNPKLKAFLTFPAFDTIETWYVWLFVIDEFEGELIDSPEGVLEWIDNEKLLDLNLWEGDRVFLKCLNQEGLFSGKFIYEDYKLVDYSFERVL